MQLGSNVTRRRWVRMAVVIGVTAAIVAPTAVWAADRFTDVPDTNVFHDDITWLANAGVTLGCNPPDNTLFCPGDNVTREQMAAFMRRLAKNQVVDAATAVTAEDAATAATAEDADMLGGEEPEAYTTQIDAASQDFYVGGAAGSFTGYVELLDLTVDVPVDSLASVSGTASFYKGTTGSVRLAVWIQTDNATCSDYQDTMPGGRTWISIGEDAESLTYASGSVSAAVALTAGSHTLTMCAESLDSATINIIDSAMTSVASASGTVLAPTDSGDSAPAIDPGE